MRESNKKKVNRKIERRLQSIRLSPAFILSIVRAFSVLFLYTFFRVFLLYRLDKKTVALAVLCTPFALCLHSTLHIRLSLSNQNHSKLSIFWSLLKISIQFVYIKLHLRSIKYHHGSFLSYSFAHCHHPHHFLF